MAVAHIGAALGLFALGLVLLFHLRIARLEQEVLGMEPDHPFARFMRTVFRLGMVTFVLGAAAVTWLLSTGAWHRFSQMG